MPPSSLRIHSDLNESSLPASFHRWSMKVANTEIFLYLSVAPQHAVSDNSATFLRLERVMMKTIDVESTIPSPLTLQEKKIVAVASCHTRHQSGYTTESVLSMLGRSFLKPLVSTIFLTFKLLVYVQRYVQHEKW